jgi:hypothetical protein
MDVGTGIAILGPSALTLKLLGPTADYIGDGVKGWAKHRVENVQRIFNVAEYKVDEAALDEPGTVPSRVLKGILDEGSFREDDVGVEYFAGVLAGSRSEDGYDDRGAMYNDVIDGMSSFQLRAHYVLYRAAQAVAAKHPEVSWYVGEERERLQHLAVPSESFFRAMAIPGAAGTTNVTSAHIMTGLGRLSLVGRMGHGQMASPEFLRTEVKNVDWPTRCLVFHVSGFGVELFCAAHGFSASPLDDFKRATNEFGARWRAEIPSCDALIVADLPPYVVPPADDAPG